MTKNESIDPVGRIGWRLILVAAGLLPVLALPRVRSFDVRGYLQHLRSTHPGGAGRFVLALLLAAGVSACLLALATRAPRRCGTGLWAAALALGIGPVLAGAFGTSPRFPTSHLALPLLATAAYLLPPVPPEWLVRQAKAICLFYVYGSAVAVLVAPSWALEMPYDQGYISALPVRLHGLTVHASQLALWCVLYLLLDLWRPSRSFVARFSRLAVIGTLFFTQYKTAWAVMILSYAFWRLLLGDAQRNSRARLAAAVALVLGLAPMLGRVNVSDFSPEQQRNLTTLTGRTQIWEATLETWRDNRLFGYGPHLWDAEMALRQAPRLGWTPAQSHNQYLQSLAEAGVIGVVGLVVHLFILGKFSLRYRRHCGIAVLLLVVLVARGITDTWYRGSVSDGNLFFQFVTLSLLMCLSRSVRSTRVRAREVPSRTPSPALERRCVFGDPPVLPRRVSLVP